MYMKMKNKIGGHNLTMTLYSSCEKIDQSVLDRKERWKLLAVKHECRKERRIRMR